jgi:hypothetical protein
VIDSSNNNNNNYQSFGMPNVPTDSDASSNWQSVPSSADIDASQIATEAFGDVAMRAEPERINVLHPLVKKTHILAGHERYLN